MQQTARPISKVCSGLGAIPIDGSPARHKLEYSGGFNVEDV